MKDFWVQRSGALRRRYPSTFRYLLTRVKMRKPWPFNHIAAIKPEQIADLLLDRIDGLLQEPSEAEKAAQPPENPVDECVQRLLKEIEDDRGDPLKPDEIARLKPFLTKICGGQAFK